MGFLEQKEDKAYQCAKFFFIKDRIDGGELKVLDCPTESMWAGVLTRLLQGMAFKQNRARLMNCPVEYDEVEEDASDELLTGEDLFPSRHCRNVLRIIRI